MTKYIIKKDEEHQCVDSLDGCEGWDVLSEFEGELPEYHTIVNGQAVPILAEYKRCKWNEVKAIRYAKENGVALTPIGEVQIDEVSKTKIMGVLDTCKLCEELGIPFAETFTLNNNDTVELSGASIRQMALAVSLYISQVYARSRVLRAAIENAANMTELEAIDTEANWP